MHAVLMVLAVLAWCGNASSSGDGGADLANGLSDIDRGQTACAKMTSCGVDL